MELLACEGRVRSSEVGGGAAQDEDGLLGEPQDEGAGDGLLFITPVYLEIRHYFLRFLSTN